MNWPGLWRRSHGLRPIRFRSPLRRPWRRRRSGRPPGPCSRSSSAAGDDDGTRIAAVRRAAPRAELIVDANEGWTGDNLAQNLAACADAGVTLIEQPLPEGHDAALARIKRADPGLRRRERARSRLARRARRQIRRRQHQARQGRRPDRGAGARRGGRAARLCHHGRLHGGDVAGDGAGHAGGAAGARGRSRRPAAARQGSRRRPALRRQPRLSRRSRRCGAEGRAAGWCKIRIGRPQSRLQNFREDCHGDEAQRSYRHCRSRRRDRLATIGRGARPAKISGPADQDDRAVSAGRPDRHHGADGGAGIDQSRRPGGRRKSSRRRLDHRHQGRRRRRSRRLHADVRLVGLARRGAGAVFQPRPRSAQGVRADRDGGAVAARLRRQ